jgi:hypothetical protein
MRAGGLAICLVLFATISMGCGEPEKHPSGKDTIASFGDGTWQIGKTGGGPTYPRKIFLLNVETQENLVYDIADWRQEGDWVYALGADGKYAVLNFRTNMRGRYESIDQAPEAYRQGLRKLRPKQ